MVGSGNKSQLRHPTRATRCKALIGKNLPRGVPFVPKCLILCELASRWLMGSTAPGHSSSPALPASSSCLLCGHGLQQPKSPKQEPEPKDSSWAHTKPEPDN